MFILATPDMTVSQARDKLIPIVVTELGTAEEYEGVPCSWSILSPQKENIFSDKQALTF